MIHQEPSMQDPFAYRRLFNLSMSYGGVVFAFMCYEPLHQLTGESITPDRLRETAGTIGALLPVGMAVAAVVAALVRSILFRCGGINRRSLSIITLLGVLWHLPLTLPLARAAADHDAGAWQLPLYFTGVALAASLALLLTLLHHRSKLQKSVQFFG